MDSAKNSSNLKSNSSKGWCFTKPKPPPHPVNKDELRKRLTPVQFRVTQEKATERPFSGEYLKLKDNGMYACVVCGYEIFSSDTKYESGCGWPAFYDVTDNKKVQLKPDLSHIGSNLLLIALKPDLVRTEVLCSNCGSHLGHLFDDGPKPTGKRYCINSAALKFKEGASSEDTVQMCANQRRHSDQTELKVETEKSKSEVTVKNIRPAIDVTTLFSKCNLKAKERFSSGAESTDRKTSLTEKKSDPPANPSSKVPALDSPPVSERSKAMASRRSAFFNMSETHL